MLAHAALLAALVATGAAIRCYTCNGIGNCANSQSAGWRVEACKRNEFCYQLVENSAVYVRGCVRSQCDDIDTYVLGLTDCRLCSSDTCNGKSLIRKGPNSVDQFPSSDTDQSGGGSQDSGSAGEHVSLATTAAAALVTAAAMRV